MRCSENAAVFFTEDQKPITKQDRLLIESKNRPHKTQWIEVIAIEHELK